MSREKFEAEAAQLALLSEAQDLELTAQARRAQRKAKLVESGVHRVILPRDFAWVVRDRFPVETRALEAVRRFEYAHSGLGLHDANVLMLAGPKGVGKTVAAAWLLARPERMLRGKPIESDVRMYVTAERLRLAHRARTHEFERACVARVLVVDELGTEGDDREEALSAPHASPSAQRSLLELITYRAGDALALTVLVGNLAREVIVQRYDGRTLDKIGQRAKWAVVDGANLRVPLEHRADYRDALAKATGREEDEP